MTSLITSTATAAHSAFAALLAKAQITPGGAIPTSPSWKEDSAEETVALDLVGRNLIIGVPGAFTPPCSSQVPGYIEQYEKFKEKGISNIYVVAVNDVFVTKAWKKQLAPQGTPVRFIADDTGSFVSALGLLFDATPVLGAPRSKRFVIIAEDAKAVQVIVEQDSNISTVTQADAVLAQL